MDKRDLTIFLERMSEAMLEAGALAKRMQGKVENIGKHVDHAKEGTEVVREVTEAKTIIDEQAQEILLKAASYCLDRKSVTVDGEEKTPSLSLFPNRENNTVLVLDPIDGTLEYLAGRDTYSIVVGLLKGGKVLCALVYFPSMDVLYFLDTDGIGKVAKQFSIYRFTHAALLKKRASQRKRIFVNYPISSTIINKLKKAGFPVVRDMDLESVNWTKAILGLLAGEYSVLLFQSPQIRDILLGAITGTAKGVYVVDWKGKPLVWSNGGRVPYALFSIGKIDRKVLQSLAGSKQ